MTTKIDDLVTRFLTWPVPADVYPDGTPGQPGRTDRQDRREVFATLNILARVEWSKTTRGGKQYDLLADDEPRACASSYGLCE